MPLIRDVSVEGAENCCVCTRNVLGNRSRYRFFFFDNKSLSLQLSSSFTYSSLSGTEDTPVQDVVSIRVGKGRYSRFSPGIRNPGLKAHSFSLG